MRRPTTARILRAKSPFFGQQLDDLADTVPGMGSSIVARGEAALEETLKSARELVAKYGDTAKSIAQDTVKLKDKATDTLIEQTETRPLTTFAAIVGVGFLAGWLCRRQEPAGTQTIPAGPAIDDRSPPARGGVRRRRAFPAQCRP